MVIDDTFLNELTAKARSSQRLRVNFDLRDSSTDQSQRMLNVLEPGTSLPVHRHTYSSETVVIIRGSVSEQFYDDDGRVTESITLSAKEGPKILVVPQGRWHRLICNEPGSVLFVSKNGQYCPLSPSDIMSIDE